MIREIHYDRFYTVKKRKINLVYTLELSQIFDFQRSTTKLDKRSRPTVGKPENLALTVVSKVVLYFLNK